MIYILIKSLVNITTNGRNLAVKKILGIIAEYNPFHNGHKYQIERAKELSGADFVVCLISGNFVQRGEASIYSSYDRARMALDNGACAVFEMPVYFSTSSAESFALYGVDFFTKLGVDYLSFGVEDASLEELSFISEILTEEKKEFKVSLNKYLIQGDSFPLAREKALLEVLEESVNISIKRLKKILASPNNILGIEYIKAIKKLNSGLKPVIVRRTDDNYNNSILNAVGPSSATAIRKEILLKYNKSKDFSKLEETLPKSVFDMLYYLNPMSSDYSLQMLAGIIDRHIFEKKNFDIYLDISAGLANRIAKYYEYTSTYGELVGLLKSKQYTYTRISRAFTHILLDIKKEDFNKYKNEACSYAKLLGFRQLDIEVLNILKLGSSVPIISKERDAKKKLDDLSLNLYNHNKYADKIYNSIYYYKHKESLQNLIYNVIIV